MDDADLRDYGYAPGSYRCWCGMCAYGFDGDKRAIRCKSCAEKSARGRKPLQQSVFPELSGNPGELPSPAPRVSAEMVEDMDALAHWFKTVPEPGTYAATTMLGRVMRVRSALIAALAVSEGK